MSAENSLGRQFSKNGWTKADDAIERARREEANVKYSDPRNRPWLSAEGLAKEQARIAKEKAAESTT